MDCPKGPDEVGKQCQEGDWDKSSFLLTIRARHTSKKRGIRKWLLPHEMDLQFTEPVAHAMRLRKQTDDELWASETRFHPELPETEDCRSQVSYFYLAVEFHSPSF